MNNLADQKRIYSLERAMQRNRVQIANIVKVHILYVNFICVYKEKRRRLIFKKEEIMSRG